jgi:hypothetical protein
VNILWSASKLERKKKLLRFLTQHHVQNLPLTHCILFTATFTFSSSAWISECHSHNQLKVEGIESETDM